MKRVLVDLLFMTGRKGGMETYVRELYQRIDQYAPGIEFVGLASSEIPNSELGWFRGELSRLKMSGDNRGQLAATESFRLTGLAKKIGADLIHSPANIGTWSAQVPSVVTIHDLLSFVHPEFVPGIHASILRTLIRRSARAANRILTVSEASAGDIVRHLGITRDRITVTPLAASQYAPGSTSGMRRSDLLLTVANNLPHKNLQLLLDAIALLRENERPQLRIVGGNAEGFNEAIRARLLDQWVKHLGWISKDELENLYQEATAFVLPTKFEGFGLPLLEAMQRGCPVICTDLEVLREVASEAAVYVPSDNATAFSQAISNLLNSRDLQSQLSSLGKVQASQFHWESTAKLTASAFTQVLQS